MSDHDDILTAARGRRGRDRGRAERGQPAHARGRCGRARTPLHPAAAGGRLARGEQLLQHSNDDPNAASRGGHPPLAPAAHAGRGGVTDAPRRAGGR